MDEAFIALDQAVNKNPKRAEIYVKLTKELEKSKKDDAVVAYFEKNIIEPERHGA